jgi:DinB superfamily/Pentapeptide repeats (8 copies)
MPRELADTDELRGAHFTRVDLSGAVFRDVDLSRIHVIDAMLADADISGYIGGMRVNGVEVAPLVEAELDRRYPERLRMRGTDPASLLDGWTAVDEMWAPTIELATHLPESTRQQRVADEWSLVETLRHLIFVTDAWFGRAVLGEPHPYHPAGLAPTFLDDPRLGLDRNAAPTFEEVLAVRRQRADRVRDYLVSVTPAELTAPRRGNDDAGYPPPSDHTVVQCLHVVMDEEWWHHQYAIRDLDTLTD